MPDHQESLKTSKKMLARAMAGTPACFCITKATKTQPSWLLVAAHPKSPEAALLKLRKDLPKDAGDLSCGEVVLEGKKLLFSIGKVGAMKPVMRSPGEVSRQLKALRQEPGMSLLAKIAVRDPQAPQDDAAEDDAPVQGEALTDEEMVALLREDGLSVEDAEALLQSTDHFSQSLDRLAAMDLSGVGDLYFTPAQRAKQYADIGPDRQARIDEALAALWPELEKSLMKRSEEKSRTGLSFNEDKADDAVVYFYPSPESYRQLYEQTRFYAAQYLYDAKKDEVDADPKRVDVELRQGAGAAWEWFYQEVWIRGRAPAQLMQGGTNRYLFVRRKGDPLRDDDLLKGRREEILSIATKRLRRIARQASHPDARKLQIQRSMEQAILSQVALYFLSDEQRRAELQADAAQALDRALQPIIQSLWEAGHDELACRRRADLDFAPQVGWITERANVLMRSVARAHAKKNGADAPDDDLSFSPEKMAQVLSGLWSILGLLTATDYADALKNQSALENHLRLLVLTYLRASIEADYDAMLQEEPRGLERSQSGTIYAAIDLDMLDLADASQGIYAAIDPKMLQGGSGVIADGSEQYAAIDLADLLSDGTGPITASTKHVEALEPDGTVEDWGDAELEALGDDTDAIAALLERRIEEEDARRRDLSEEILDELEEIRRQDPLDDYEDDELRALDEQAEQEVGDLDLEDPEVLKMYIEDRTIEILDGYLGSVRSAIRTAEQTIAERDKRLGSGLHLKGRWKQHQARQRLARLYDLLGKDQLRAKQEAIRAQLQREADSIDKAQRLADRILKSGFNQQMEALQDAIFADIQEDADALEAAMQRLSGPPIDEADLEAELAALEQEEAAPQAREAIRETLKKDLVRRKSLSQQEEKVAKKRREVEVA